MRDCRWNTRSRLTEGSPYEHLSYSLGTRIKESRDLPPGLLVEVQRHGLELEQQGCESGEELTAIETPSEGRRRNALEDLAIVVVVVSRSIFPPMVGRDC